MIDLTPLDVRKKKGDFRRGMRGYESAVVDEFLDLVAERLEELVRENAQLREKVGGLTESIATFREREKAMNEALVSAQQLREEVREQAARDADLAVREAKLEAERIMADAKQQAAAAAESLRRITARRARFLRSFRSMLDRQLAELAEEDGREDAPEEGTDQP